jgi:hypothetical protein
MIEVQLVNSVAPLYYAIASLKYEKDNTGQKTYYQRFGYGREISSLFLKKHGIHTLIWQSCLEYAYTYGRRRIGKIGFYECCGYRLKLMKIQPNWQK